MRVTAAIILMVLFLVEPLSAQRLPRTRSRHFTPEAEATTVEKIKAKFESKTSTESSTNATSTTPSADVSPQTPSPSPSPPPPSSSPKPSATPKDGGNTTSTKPSTTTTTPEPSAEATPSVAPPISSVHVRMAFSPSKKILEERNNSKSTPTESDSKTDSKSESKSKKSLDNPVILVSAESTKEPSKKPTSNSTSLPTSTTTVKPTSLPPSNKKVEQDEELRDVLKKIHQEVLKQPRTQETKNRSSNSSTTTKKPPKEEKGLETAETSYVRPTTIQLHPKEVDSTLLDAQASVQSTKFVLRDQGLQQLPSFVRSKDRSRQSPPNTLRHVLIQKPTLTASQKQPLTAPLLQPFQQRQRSQHLADPIDEEGNTSTTSTAYPIIPIVHFDKEQSADGSYKTSYETANNIFAEETGFLKNPGVEDQEALVQQGSYSYTAPDGSLISVTYTADEMGFRAAGTHLPTPPPVPPEIQRSLDIIYAQIQRDEEEAEREAELERRGEASERHEESLSPPSTGSKRESRRYLPKQGADDQY